jgi:hypothetical protein
MKRVIPLVFVACAVAVTSVVSDDKTEEDGGPFAGEEIQLMKHAEAVYIFSVKTNSPETPNQKDLRCLGFEARQALVETLCNLDNWNFVTGGSEDCEPHDVGLLFQNSKDRLILRFCSVCDSHIGCGVDKTPRPDIKRGLDKAAAMGILEKEICAVGDAKMRSNQSLQPVSSLKAP